MNNHTWNIRSKLSDGVLRPLFSFNDLYYIGSEFKVLLKTETLKLYSMMNVTLHASTATRIMRVLLFFRRNPMKTSAVPKNIPGALSVTASGSKAEKNRPILPMSYYID
jgi:hypothetical protein